MEKEELNNWISDILPQHKLLTNSVVSIVKNLLDKENIDFLSVTGRTKDKKSIVEKVNRKSYKNPKDDLTDLSGIRIIVYFESDIKKVSKLINSSFDVDKKNSLDKDTLLATNQIGYRSVHFVCDLGKKRAVLPEFETTKNLKFEFQVRTVLQHAWAELAHDRNYKFTGKLPPELERKLYLYAGMLEIADKGFDELSNKIIEYTTQIEKKVQKGNFDIEINSISLEEFVYDWAKTNNYPLEKTNNKDLLSRVIDELNQFSIYKISELEQIIPKDFGEKIKNIDYSTSIIGLIRHWMLIHDYKKFYENVSFNWILTTKSSIFKLYLSDKEITELYNLFDPEELRYDNE